MDTAVPGIAEMEGPASVTGRSEAAGLARKMRDLAHPVMKTIDPAL